jgi:hypothetical protein
MSAHQKSSTQENLKNVKFNAARRKWQHNQNRIKFRRKDEHVNQAILFEHETSRSQRHVCISLLWRRHRVEESHIRRWDSSNDQKKQIRQRIKIKWNSQ